MKRQMELTIRRLAEAEGKPGEEIMPVGPITGPRVRMRILKLMDGWEPARILNFAEVVAEEEPTLLGAERQSVGTLVRENEGPPQLHLKPVQPHYLTGKSKTQGFTSGSEDPLIPVTFTIFRLSKLL